MKNLAIAALMSLSATAAFAEPSCTPGETLAPVYQAIQTFEDAGGVVVSFKINSGKCYEIYGTVDGENMEVFFDPNTSEEIGRQPA